MKASELRIGNLVKDQSDKYRIWTVIGIDEKVIEVRGTDSIAEHLQLIEYILPIPLTEEWLIKFGFVDGKTHLTPFFYIRIETGILQVNPQDGVVCINSNGGDPFLNPQRIKYVHQLQNLYYALTSTELTPKD